jgi:DNA gyrase subunit A
LKYSENQMRPMGRNAGGVMGIRLRPGDQVAGAEVVEEGADLLVVTEGGFGKRTPISEYKPKSRGSQGMSTINQYSIPEIGKIAVARVVTQDDELTLISAGGIVMRMKAAKVSQTGRATRGVKLMDLEKGNKVASLARIAAKDVPLSDNGNGTGNENGIENGNGNGLAEVITPEKEPDENPEE